MFLRARKTKTNKEKHITTLIDEQGNTLQKTTEILNECKNFYQKLYKKHVLTHKNNYSNKLNQKLLNCKTKNLQNKYK